MTELQDFAPDDPLPVVDRMSAPQVWIHNPNLSPYELREKLDIVTEQELADMLGVEVETLQRWRRENTGPRWTRLGKRVFYGIDALKYWVWSNEEGPEDDEDLPDEADDGGADSVESGGGLPRDRAA